MFVLFSLLGLTSGLGGLLGFAAVYLMGTALWTLLVGRSWLGRTGRRGSAPMLLAAVGLLVAGVVVDPVASVEPPGRASPAASSSTPSDPTSSPPTPSLTPSPTPELAPTPIPPPPAPSPSPSARAEPTAEPGSALAIAEGLTVKGRAPKTGYDRDLFGGGWLPPNKPFRCEYVARQVAVKHTYSLWVTQAERDAMIRILTTCPDQPLPDGTNPVPLTIAPDPTTDPSAPEDVYYPNCAAARAAGAAPLHAGEPGYRTDMDGDDDGIACE